MGEDKAFVFGRSTLEVRCSTFRELLVPQASNIERSTSNDRFEQVGKPAPRGVGLLQFHRRAAIERCGDREFAIRCVGLALEVVGEALGGGGIGGKNKEGRA